MKIYIKSVINTVLTTFLFLAVVNDMRGAVEKVNLRLQEYTEYKGKIIDASTRSPLVFASLVVNNTNISTVTNTEGEFALKIPSNQLRSSITISSLGYITKTINISELKKDAIEIKLEASVIELSEVDISIPKDARALVQNALKKRDKNYFQQQTEMTAFYRESIKKRRKNVSLSEAVVTIYKRPNKSLKRDIVALYKSRKKTDYKKIDTIALKLQGGPYSTLYLDVMKYPEYILAEDLISSYDFSFETATKINGELVYVISFKQKASIIDPLYYGKLFINAESQALSSAVFNLNIENKELASRLFIKKKPGNVSVQPTDAAYRVDYREKDGKWYYGYGRIDLTMKINSSIPGHYRLETK